MLKFFFSRFLKSVNELMPLKKVAKVSYRQKLRWPRAAKKIAQNAEKSPVQKRLKILNK